MYDLAKYEKMLSSMLSKKRFSHSKNVSAAAKQLARLYGADLEAATVAGLLHDICKELPPDEQRVLAAGSGYPLSEEELSSRQLWHAVAGACYIKHKLSIDDEDILNAVRYHTIGHAEMSPLEETVYLADLISEDRKYKDVARIRKLANTDKDLAMLEALSFSLTSVVEKGVYIPAQTVGAYNYYLKKCNKNKGK